MCLGRIAALRTAMKDRYHRSVARFTCGDVDASAEQVRRGGLGVHEIPDGPRPDAARGNCAKAANGSVGRSGVRLASGGGLGRE